MKTILVLLTKEVDVRIFLGWYQECLVAWLGAVIIPR